MKRVGEIRVRILRVMQYFAIMTFVSSILTVVKVYDLPWWLTFLALPPFGVLYWLDPRVARGEAAYFNDNNEMLQDLLRDVRAIKTDVVKLSAKIPVGE